MAAILPARFSFVSPVEWRCRGTPGSLKSYHQYFEPSFLNSFTSVLHCSPHGRHSRVLSDVLLQNRDIIAYGALHYHIIRPDSLITPALQGGRRLSKHLRSLAGGDQPAD